MSEFEPASKLIDRYVEDVNGELIGRVSELFMDIDRGQIEYVLITLDRTARSPTQVTIPWSIVRMDSRGVEHWRLSVNRRALENLARVVSGV